MGGAGHASSSSANVDELGELVDEVHENEGVLRDDPAQLGGVGDVVVGAGEEGDADDAEGDDGAAKENHCVYKFTLRINIVFPQSLPEVREPVDGKVEDEAPVEQLLLRRAHRPQRGRRT